MFRLVEDFLSEWNYESEKTLTLLSKLEDDSLNIQVHPKIRTIKNLSWHIVSTPNEMLERAGLKMTGIDHEAPAPETIKEILDSYLIAIEQVKLHVPEWADADLLEKVNMYGEEWRKGTVLNVLIKHQAHHRGELLMLMRMNNLPVIGVYGPTFEEWQKMGMDPMV